ncbi:hypothetical protein F511_42050 [Dorcoceras hygrometricum]|uniref:Uncharacterized protein n=1 Tax=Dorcoceras hygrometricum TaxID=472368 RepID=A0A2Z7C3C4_9LAMI|nr:hypothetical protein F511_42050 [Dorcoceras hygrometricum]
MPGGAPPHAGRTMPCALAAHGGQDMRVVSRTAAQSIGGRWPLISRTKLRGDRAWWPRVGRWPLRTGCANYRSTLHAGGARWLLVLRNRCAKTKRDARRAPCISRPSARPCAARDFLAAGTAVRQCFQQIDG